jgi:hypothetical protein
LLCTSCADLSAVAKFAATAKSASTGFSDIANDFAGSTLRRAEYVRDEEKPEVLKQADTYKELEPDMLAAQKVLTDYIAALATISTDGASASKSDNGKSGSGKSDSGKGGDSDSGGGAGKGGGAGAATATKSGLEKAGLSSDQASAGMTLASKVATALLAGYRSKKTGEVIHDCNPSLQDYLKGLEEIVGTDYPKVLDNEKISVEGYYSRLKHDYGDKEPLAVKLMKVNRQNDLDAIAKRQQAATAYMKILTDIGEGHQKLYDAGEHMGVKELAPLIEPYIEDIATQSKVVAKAF